MWQFYLVLLLCFLLVASYVAVPFCFPTVPLNRLWGGVHNPVLRNLYMVSIFFCAVGFVLVLAYSHSHMSSSLFEALCTFLLLSFLWMPFMYGLLTHPASVIFKAMVVGILFAVACCALWVALSVLYNKDDASGEWHTWVTVGGFYVFFHTLVLDFALFSALLP